MKYYFLFLLTIALSSCGGGPNPDRDALNAVPAEQNLSGSKFEFLSSPENLLIRYGVLSGHGKLRFAQDLESVDSSYNFFLHFTLNEGSDFSFVSHSDKDLNAGVTLHFKRKGEQLLVFVTSAGVTDDWSTYLSSVSASGDIQLSLDVHNNEGVSHIVLWDVVSGVKLFDSAAVDGLAGRGQGQQWGVLLCDARVLNIRKGRPQNAH